MAACSRSTGLSDSKDRHLHAAEPDTREGLAANFVAAALVGIGAPLGLPMSTTYVAFGAILVIAAEQRMPANRNVIAEMMIAWVVTLPADRAGGEKSERDRRAFEEGRAYCWRQFRYRSS